MSVFGVKKIIIRENFVFNFLQLKAPWISFYISYCWEVFRTFSWFPLDSNWLLLTKYVGMKFVHLNYCSQSMDWKTTLEKKMCFMFASRNVNLIKYYTFLWKQLMTRQNVNVCFAKYVKKFQEKTISKFQNEIDHFCLECLRFWVNLSWIFLFYI